MINDMAERLTAKILGAGSAFIAVVVVTGTVMDPVNVTKFFALGGIAISALFVSISFQHKRLWSDHKIELFFAVGLILASFNAIISSTSPLTQNLYGVFGRNTGFLTYLLLVALFVASLAIRNIKYFPWLLFGLFAAGLINVIYCLWALYLGDPIPWSNPYGNILGTFGNPNFIGAFLGIFLSTMVAYILKPGTTVFVRLCALAVLVIGTFEIIKSNAIQGRVVLAGGLAIVGFFYVRSRFKGVLMTSSYVVLASIGGVMAVLGALQIGPLSKFIYKTSVSLRGEYWQAGFNMGRDNLWTGVGFDSYGDWYRRARDAQALILPGPNTTTNAAHNVVLDVFAFGGLPLLVCYLGFIALSAIAIIKVTLRHREFDAVFVGLTTGWVTYQVQSIISINQIGLAIWGWLFGGALIAYERSTRDVVDSKSSTKSSSSGRNARRSSENIFSPQLIASIGAVAGLMLACPPYFGDSSYRTALQSGNAAELEKALTPRYLAPATTYKYADVAQKFEAAGLTDLAYKYTKIAIEFNPNSYEAWSIFSQISKSTPEEKQLALENLRRLDPLNPAFKG
jgi:hypothetical protein